MWASNGAKPRFIVNYKASEVQADAWVHTLPTMPHDSAAPRLPLYSDEDNVQFMNDRRLPSPCASIRLDGQAELTRLAASESSPALSQFLVS